MKLGDQLRKFIRDSGESHYRIAKDAGIDTASLGRFMKKERGLSLPVIERLVDYFELELKRQRKSKAK